jgi:Ni,Fe-hydrogenase I cytochrome b subunit
MRADADGHGICTDSYHRELIWREGDEKYYPKGVNERITAYIFYGGRRRYFPGSRILQYKGNDVRR